MERERRKLDAKLFITLVKDGVCTFGETKNEIKKVLAEEEHTTTRRDIEAQLLIMLVRGGVCKLEETENELKEALVEASKKGDYDDLLNT